MTARAKRAGYFWPRFLTQAIGSRLVRRPRRRRNQPSRPPPAKTRPNNPALLCRDVRSRPCKFASAPSASSAERSCLLSHPNMEGLDRPDPLLGRTDDADGADGIFSARAHPNHPGVCPAFTREHNFDPEVRRKVCARRSRPASARGFFAHPLPLEMLASTLRTQTQKV